MPGQTPTYGIPYPTLEDPSNMGPQIEANALAIDQVLTSVQGGLGPALAGSVAWEPVSWTPTVGGLTGTPAVTTLARKLAGIVWLSLIIGVPAGQAVHFTSGVAITVTLPYQAAGPASDEGYFNPGTGGAYVPMQAGIQPQAPTIFYIHSVPAATTAPKYHYLGAPSVVAGTGNWAAGAQLRVQLMYRTATDGSDGYF